MKNQSIGLAALCFVALTGSVNAGIMINVDGTRATEMRISRSDFGGRGDWDTLPFPDLTLAANIYWDADNNGVFGETGIGENTGNTSSSLSFSIDPIVSHMPYYFGMDGFTSDASPVGIEFILTNSDGTTQPVSVTTGTKTRISDSNGDMWDVNFEFNYQFYGNVVSNLNTGPGVNSMDHQGVLTFEQVPVPEPTSLAIFGIGALGLVAGGTRRKKRIA